MRPRIDLLTGPPRGRASPSGRAECTCRLHPSRLLPDDPGMTIQRVPKPSEEQRHGPHRSGGVAAYVAREAAELALLLAALAIVAVFVSVPTWILLALPSTKVAISTVAYAAFFRKSLRRPASHGTAALIGKEATTVTSLRPTGQVKVRGELWPARSMDGKAIARDSVVRIVLTQGNTMLVSHMEDHASPASCWNSDKPR